MTITAGMKRDLGHGLALIYAPCLVVMLMDLLFGWSAALVVGGCWFIGTLIYGLFRFEMLSIPLAFLAGFAGLVVGHGAAVMIRTAAQPEAPGISVRQAADHADAGSFQFTDGQIDLGFIGFHHVKTRNHKSSTVTETSYYAVPVIPPGFSAVEPVTVWTGGLTQGKAPRVTGYPLSAVAMDPVTRQTVSEAAQRAERKHGLHSSPNAVFVTLETRAARTERYGNVVVITALVCGLIWIGIVLGVARHQAKAAAEAVYSPD